MPTIPRFPLPAQEDAHVHAVRLAAQLTPIQRQVLVQAGMPRWLALSHPWRPAPGRLRAVARVLTLPEFGLLAPLHEHDAGVELTRMGEAVAGIWLLAALIGPSGLTGTTGTPDLPSSAIR